MTLTVCAHAEGRYSGAGPSRAPRRYNKGLTSRMRERHAPATQLLRLVEIARYLGVSKQRVHQLADGQGFPRPAKRLPSGRLWEAFAIDEWARREWWGSRPWRGGSKTL